MIPRHQGVIGTICAGLLVCVALPDAWDNPAPALNEAAVRRDPLNLITLHNLSHVQHVTGHFDGAIAFYRRALSLSPGYARQGRVLELSAKEFDLLGLLVCRRGEVLTRDEILKQVWGYEDPPMTRTVDTHILRLRQKIEPDPAKPSYIQTVYPSGYRFAG